MRFLVLLWLFAFEAHADPVRLRVGTLAVDDSRYVRDILAMSKDIELRTKRTVRFDWVTGGQLGDDAAMAKLIREGKLDGGGLSELGLIALVPEMAAWQYPGLFRDYADVDRATAALDRSIRARFETQDLVFAMWADLGFANLFSTKPIANLRELLGRAMLSTPIDQTLVEAIVNHRTTAWALPPLYQVVIGAERAKVITELRYRYVVGGLVLSKAAWTKLTPAQQAIVLDTCREYEPKLRASWRAETERGIAALTKAGVELRVFSAAENESFFAAAAKRAGPELVTAIRASLAR